MNKDAMSSIIDKYSLGFLDGFEEAYGRLPNDLERSIWMHGYIDGCKSIEEALSLEEKHI